MQKRGQVSIYIILGVVLVIVIASAIYFTSKKPTTETALAKTVQKSTVVPLVEEAIISCFSQLSKEGVLLLGKQGGFLEQPQNALSKEDSFLALYGENNNKEVPDKVLFENSLQQHLKENLEPCLNKEQFAPFELEVPQPGVKVTAENALRIDLTLPVSIVAEDEKLTTQDEYSLSYELKIPKYLEVSRKLIEQAMKDSKDINFEHVLDAGFNLDLFPEENLNTYILADDTLIGEEKFELRFAYAY